MRAACCLLSASMTCSRVARQRLTLLGRGKKLRLPSACRLMASSCQGRAPSQGQHGLVATSAAGYLGTALGSSKAGRLAWRLAPASGSSCRALAPLASTSRSASLQQPAARTLGLGGAGSRAVALLASSSSSSSSANSFATVAAKLCCSHRSLGWLLRGPLHAAPLSAGGAAANSTVAADAASVISTQASTLLSSVQEGATHEALWAQLQAAVQAVQQSGAAGQGDEGVGRTLASALAAQADDSIDGMTGPQLSALSWLFGCLGHADAAAATRIMEVLYSKLSELACQDLAGTIWSQAVTGQYHHEVFASLTEFVWERCLAATPKQLAVLAASYASYGHFDDDQDFFDALSASFFKKLQSSSVSDVALMLKALAVLQHNASTAAIFPGETKAEDELLGKGSGAKPAPGGPTPPHFFPEACRHVAVLLQDPSTHASPSDLADIVWACAWMGHHDRALMEAVAERLLALTQQVAVQPQVRAAGVHWAQADRLREQQAEGGGGNGSGGNGDAAKGGTQGAGGGAAGSAADGAATSASETAEAGHGRPALFRNCVLAGGLLSSGACHNPCLPTSASAPSGEAEGGVDSLQHPEPLTKVLWAFCSLRHWHPRLLPVLVELLRPVAAEQLDAVQAARVGNAHIAMLEIVPGMSPVPTKGTQLDAVWRHIYNAWPLGLRAPDPLLPRALSHALMQELYEDDLFNYQSWKYRPTADITRSGLCASVLHTLGKLGLKPWPAPTFDGTMTPHIGVLLKPGSGTLNSTLPLESVDGSSNGAVAAGAAGTGAQKKAAAKALLSLAIELLDPSACMRNEPHAAIGPVQSRHRSLRFRGWKVLAIPFHEWLALAEDEAARTRYLEERIQAIQAEGHTTR